MKTIGLIGGMSWESTVTYYQIINEIVKKELGGLHSAKCILYSVDFDEIERCQSAGAWEKSGEILGKAAESLEAAGADFILICTNTMHKVFEQVQRYVNVPFIHIAQATADILKRENITSVSLLETKYTMEQDFYKGKLAENGSSVVIPDCLMVDSFFTINYITLLAAAGVGMAGQQRQQVAALLDFDHVHFMGLNNLNIGHRVGQRFPQVGKLHGIARLQVVYMPEVVRTAPAPVACNNAVSVVAADRGGGITQLCRSCREVVVGCTQIDRHGQFHSRNL